MAELLRRLQRTPSGGSNSPVRLVSVRSIGNRAASAHQFGEGMSDRDQGPAIHAAVSLGRRDAALERAASKIVVGHSFTTDLRSVRGN